MVKKRLITALLLTAACALAAADHGEESPVSFFIEGEQGAISILHHEYQSGETGTTFDFVRQGGQEILYPFQRFTAGFELNETHRLAFIYQPLELITNVTFRDKVTVDGVDFAENTPMELTYSFPFYRFTYTYDLLGGDPNRVFGVGASLQLRNAAVKFKTLSGDKLTVAQNLGPVPALSIYSRWEFPQGLVLSAEITGLYASSAIINGASFEFEGSILDASLRAGWRMENGSEVFGNVRFFGGTSNGVSQYPNLYWTKAEEDYGMNNLATVTASVGVSIR